MGTAFGGIDVIGKGQQIFTVTIGILHRYFCHTVIPAAFHIDHIGMQGSFIAV